MAALVRSTPVSLSGSALCCTDFPTNFELGEGFLHSATLHSLDVPTVFCSSEKTCQEKTHRGNEKNIEGHRKMNVSIPYRIALC